MKPGDLIAANATYFPANATVKTTGIALRSERGGGRVATDLKLNQVGLVLAVLDVYHLKSGGHQFLLVAANGVYGWVLEKYVVLA